MYRDPMPSRRSSFLPILAVLAIAGCTSPFGPSGPSSGPGVTILSWQPELPSVFSDEGINFLLKVQNQGESRARNAVAEMTNIDLNEWGGGFFQQQLQLGDLIAFDPVTNTPGETKTAKFQGLRAPKLARGTSFQYEPTVRVSYDYTTTAQKPITIVDRQELIRIQQQGRTLPTKTTTFSSGPLSVDIIMGNFVRTSSQFTAGQQFDIFPVHIRIVNTRWEQGGSVTQRGFTGTLGGFGGGQFDYPVLVKITPPAGTTFVNSGFFGDDCSSFQFTAELFQGKQAEITCELEVTNPPAARSESLIRVELEYRFFIDAVTQVKVQGTEEAGGLFR